MRIVKTVLFSALLLAFMPAIGSAQDRPVHFNIGGGPTFVMGDLGDKFNMGWGPAIGVTFDTSEQVGFQFEYAYRWFALKDEADAAIGLLDANHQTHELSGNIILNLTQPDSPVRFYIAAGPGMFYRKVEITRYAGTGVVCDPWYLRLRHVSRSKRCSARAAAGTSASTSARASASRWATRASSTSSRSTAM